MSNSYLERVFTHVHMQTENIAIILVSIDVNIDDLVNFDISLTSQPIFTPSYFTINHKVHDSSISSRY